jgi:hypothetical protein
MDSGMRNKVIFRISPLMAGLLFSGCAATASPARDIAPDRLSDAANICRDTLGLDPANAPHDECVRSLLQNVSASNDPMASHGEDAGSGEMPGDPLLAGLRSGCTQFGVAPGSSGFETCVANLGASLFEANNTPVQ